MAMDRVLIPDDFPLIAVGRVIRGACPSCPPMVFHSDTMARDIAERLNRDELARRGAVREEAYLVCTVCDAPRGLCDCRTADGKQSFQITSKTQRTPLSQQEHDAFHRALRGDADGKIR